MATNVPSGPQDNRKSVKAPLVFSAVLATVAGVATMIFSTGGATKALRWDLGLTAAIIAFIASLMISAMLLMTEKPNPEEMGKGSGINLSSAKIPGGAGSVGRRQAAAQDSSRQAGPDSVPDAPRDKGDQTPGSPAA